MHISLLQKKYLHIILPAFIGSVIAYLDRINIAYAALTMNTDLGFSAQIYGAGAGVFFIGHVIFENGWGESFNQACWITTRDPQ